MIAAYKTTFSGSLTKSTDLEYIDIDLDLKDPQLCSVYAPDIYNNLRTAEVCTLGYFHISLSPFVLCILITKKKSGIFI